MRLFGETEPTSPCTELSVSPIKVNERMGLGQKPYTRNIILSQQLLQL